MILDIQRRTPVKGLSVAALALLIATPALAGGLDDGKRGVETKGLPAPALQSTDDHSWTGLWLGAYGGYGMSNSELSLDNFFDQSGGANGTGIDGIGVKKTPVGSVDGFGGEGLTGQLQIGFDKQIGDRLLVGVFGGAKLSGGESDVSIDGKTDLTVEEGNTYFGMARVGYLLNAHNLLYVAGGYFWNVDTEIKIAGTPGETIKQDFQGFVGEVGFESRIAENVYARLAGRYYAADTETLKFDHSKADQDCWDELDIDAGKLEVMVGLSFKLNGFKY
jgi:hypothetical protein